MLGYHSTTRNNWIVRAGQLLILFVALLAGGCKPHGGELDSASHFTTALPPRVIGFMTDFDVRDDAVGLCKAVMYGISPKSPVIDITHQVTPYSIAEGARYLAGTAPYFSDDAVFVAVVDPTVGTSRKAIVARSKRGQLFVLPDNGLLTLIQDRDGIEGVRQITNTTWMLGSHLSSTFHGRDIFSPVGAHLARGEDWITAGPELPVAELKRLDISNAAMDDNGVHGSAIGTDGPYGNLISNISSETFSRLGYHAGDVVPVTLDQKKYSFPFVKTFGEFPIGKPLFYIDSRGRLSLGFNQRSFVALYKVSPSAKITIPLRER